MTEVIYTQKQKLMESYLDSQQRGEYGVAEEVWQEIVEADKEYATKKLTALRSELDNLSSDSFPYEL